MKLHYAPHHRWIKAVTAEPELLYSASNCKRLRSTIPKVTDNAIHHDFKPLDNEFLGWFIPRYEATIGKKENAAIHDIVNKTLKNKQSESVYWCLTIWQAEEIIGGTIFGIRDDSITISYRICNPKWSNGTLQANPTLFSDYLCSVFAYQQGKKNNFKWSGS